MASLLRSAASEVLAAPTQPLDIDVEEVRLAMALNGGVSLAVWMGGVAVELDCARRAHKGVEPGQGGKPPRPVYAAICGAFQRRLVIDVMSGASAGGLNGSLLAGVIRRGRRLSPEMLRSKWIEVGSLMKLLEPMSNSHPRSLMQGGSSPQDPGVFYTQLKEMFSAVLGESEGGASAAELAECKAPEEQGPVSLDAVLDVMMTNVQGEPQKFRDYWGFELAAREYRAPFHFRRAGQFTLENLATAARASASFPFAFEPFLVTGTSARLAGFDGSRYAMDGGLLENAPIDAAIRLIPTRAANSQVKRFVCYLNAAPPRADPANNAPERATLGDVAQWVINVPRNARFVDQLYAIQEAQRRSSVSRGAQPRLLTMDWPSLKHTAETLLSTYRESRVRIALQEIVGDPAQADAVADGLGPGASVAWLPDSLDPPDRGTDWRWGARTAERTLYLELDLLRLALTLDLDPEARHKVIAARASLYESLGLLARYRRVIVVCAQKAAEESDDPLLAIEASFGGFVARILAALKQGTQAFLDVLASEFVLAQPELAALRTVIFPVRRRRVVGEPVPTPLVGFLRRALAVEVIQRAFSISEEIESGQPLHFAQITPLAPIRIFSAQPFFEESVPSSGEEKLTGIKVMHFSGFYRRAWRANDFMWGRLDGATRIVDLMVDSVRSMEVAGRTWIDLGVLLARAVLPDDATTKSDARVALVEEAFCNARVPDSGVSPQVLSLLGAFTENSDEGAALKPADELPDALRRLLGRTFVADLAGGDARFSRVLLARALQLEIVREEYEHLARESADDVPLGASTSPLPAATDDVRDSINAIRGLYYLGPAEASGGASKPLTLPRALGLGDADETTSDLALGTLARASYALLASLSGTPVLGRLLAVVRGPLLPFSGVVSRSPRVRASVVLGFAAAVAYVLVRLTTADPHLKAPLGSLWNPSVLLSWLAVLVIVGAIAAPGIRARYARGWKRKLVNGSLAAALALGALLVPVALAHWLGNRHYVQLLATPGAKGLPDLWSKALLVAVLAAPTTLALGSLPIPALSRLRSVLRRIPYDIAMGLVSIGVLGWSAWQIDDAGAGNWRGYAAASAGMATLALALYLLHGIIGPKKKPLPATLA